VKCKPKHFDVCFKFTLFYKNTILILSVPIYRNTHTKCSDFLFFPGTFINIVPILYCFSKTFIHCFRNIHTFYQNPRTFYPRTRGRGGRIVWFECENFVQCQTKEQAVEQQQQLVQDQWGWWLFDRSILTRYEDHVAHRLWFGRLSD
jgi:hypothetical protein